MNQGGEEDRLVLDERDQRLELCQRGLAVGQHVRGVGGVQIRVVGRAEGRVGGGQSRVEFLADTLDLSLRGVDGEGGEGEEQTEACDKPGHDHDHHQLLHRVVRADAIVQHRGPQSTEQITHATHHL